MYDNEIKAERAFLVGVKSNEVPEAEALSLLKELSGLATSLGLEISGSILTNLREINPATLLGRGKIDEIVNSAKAEDSDSIIFDYELSPVQQRNIEKISSLDVYDRAELIINIFASRARTKEATLQVELARLQYSLPRLAHSYGDLHRQKGGRYGTKGAGEQKIELDRRQIALHIEDIKDELENVRKARITQRKRRERLELKRVAIVGYTNAGKSSLLNAIANKSNVLAEDKLFATLDPTTRRLDTKSNSILFTDTVGFVRKLPHHLVEAFKSTLEEAALSDLLIHVVDASDPENDVHITTTKSVLQEIGAADIPVILVYNKIDKLPEENHRKNNGNDVIFVSAKSNDGLDALVEAIEQKLNADSKELCLCIPYSQYSVVSSLYSNSKVLSEESRGDSVIVRCLVPEKMIHKIQQYIVC